MRSNSPGAPTGPRAGNYDQQNDHVSGTPAGRGRGNGGSRRQDSKYVVEHTYNDPSNSCYRSDQQQDLHVTGNAGQRGFLKAPKPQDNMAFFYPPQGHYQDQLDPAFYGMGYLDKDTVCPTCLKSQATHDADTCEAECATCHRRHPGHVSLLAPPVKVPANSTIVLQAALYEHELVQDSRQASAFCR